MTPIRSGCGFCLFFAIYGFVLTLVVGFALFFAVCEFVLAFVIVIVILL
jgi:hypothetical protein